MSAGTLRKTVKNERPAARRSSGDDGLPSIEAAKVRLSKGKGFVASLTPEGLTALRDYDGPEIIGSLDHHKPL